MSKLNKTAVAVLVALGSSAVSAGTMGPVCVPGNVTVPCESCGWDIGASALYLKPIHDADFSYTDVFRDTSGDLFFNQHNHDFNWGFEIEGSYHWGTGSSINVEWYHLNTGRNRRALSPVVFDVIDTEIPLTAVPNGLFDRSTHWDAVNFIWNQAVAPSCHKYWTFYGGAQYAHIRTEDRHFFPTGGTPVVVPSFETIDKSEFNGFGPRGGWDAVYKFCGTPDGFGVFFKTAATLLVGTSKFDHASGQPLVINGIPFAHGSKDALVPELEAKLGVNYDYNCASGNWTFDLGYMWFNYWNAQHRLSDVFAKESDFAASGPYFRASYKGSNGFLFS